MWRLAIAVLAVGGFLVGAGGDCRTLTTSESYALAGTETVWGACCVDETICTGITDYECLDFDELGCAEGLYTEKLTEGNMKACNGDDTEYDICVQTGDRNCVKQHTCEWKPSLQACLLSAGNNMYIHNWNYCNGPCDDYTPPPDE